MEKTTDITQKLQQIELKMLELFVQICEKENLHYYLLGGTMLGAVRHKGFIPWDDDIDVGMPRADYEKFLLCASKYLPKGYFLQTYKTDKDYPYPYAKMRDTHTIYKENALKNLSINHGVWIDVFPLDFCPVKRFWFLWHHYLLRERIKFVLYKWEKASIKLKLFRILSCVFSPSWHNAVKRDDKLMSSYQKDTTMTANLCGAWGEREIVPTEWYGEGTTLAFEHLKVKVPVKYHQWLTQVYGDYMELPPVEKRIARHNPVEIKL